MSAKFERTVVLRTLGSAEYHRLSFRRRFLVVRALITEFEFARRFCLDRLRRLRRRARGGVQTVLTEDIPHRPAVDIGEPHGITERDSLVFTEGDRSFNTPVFVILRVFMDGLTRISGALAEFMITERLGIRQRSERTGLASARPVGVGESTTSLLCEAVAATPSAVFRLR